MAQVTYLSNEDVTQLIDFREVIASVESAYRWKAEGKTSDFPLVFHEFEPGVSDMDIKSGHLGARGVYGLKLVSFFEGNGEQGIAPLTSTMALFDDATGLPCAFLNAAAITGYRTGAAAAVGAKCLARPDSETLLMVGCGHLCAYAVGAMLLTMPQLKRVMLHNPLGAEAAERKAAALPEELAAIGAPLPAGVTVEAAADLAAAVPQADVVVTATPARTPLVERAWVRPGTHFSCLGADMSGKQEIDPRIVADSRAFCDDMAQSTAVGEFEMGLRAGAFAEAHVATEIGAVIAGQAEGRQTKDQITVFDSTGIAAQDLSAAAGILEQARKQGVGTTLAW